MKSRFSILFGLVLLVACRAAPTEGERDVLALLEAQKELWNRGELVAFAEKAYWQSPDLSFMSADTWERGFEILLERFQRNYSTPEEMGRLAFRETETRLLGPGSVLVRGRWSLIFDDRERRQGLFTLIFRYMSGEWRIVHDHTSSAPPLEPDSEPEMTADP